MFVTKVVATVWSITPQTCLFGHFFMLHTQPYLPSLLLFFFPLFISFWVLFLSPWSAACLTSAAFCLCLFTLLFILVLLQLPFRSYSAMKWRSCFFVPLASWWRCVFRRRRRRGAWWVLALVCLFCFCFDCFAVFCVICCWFFCCVLWVFIDHDIFCLAFCVAFAVISYFGLSFFIYIFFNSASLLLFTFFQMLSLLFIILCQHICFYMFHLSYDYKLLLLL